MDFLLSCLPTTVEVLFTYYLFNHYIKRNKIEYIDVIFYSLTVIIVGDFITNPVSMSLISLILCLLYLFLITNRQLTNALITYTLSTIVIIMSQLIVVVITAFLGLSRIDIKMQIFCNILTLIVIIIACKLFKLYKLYEYVISAKLPAKLLLINTFLIVYCIMFIFKDNHNTIYENIPLYLSVFSIILATNMCALYYEKSLSMKQQELMSYQKNIPVYETLIGEIRSNQHEYNNRIQTLQNLSVTCKDYDSLSKALNEYSGSIKTTTHSYPLLHINMPLLAAALYTHADKASKEDINVQFNIKSTLLKSQAPEYNLSDFACVLLQNAIEASKSGDYINVEINCINEQFDFVVRNPVERLYSKNELATFFKKGFTTKENKKQSSSTPHGYGLYYVHKQIKKYNGTIGYDCIEYENKYWIEIRFRV